MAAGGTPGNVVLGPGRLYYAPLGTTEPTSCSAALPSAWKVIGYTDAGSTIETEITSEAVEVAEELDPIRFVQTRRASRITFAMAEATVARLALAVGGGAARADDAASFEFPAPDSIVSIMMVWDKLDTPSALSPRWILRQCSPSGTIAAARQKAPNKSTIPVTFNLELPTGQTSPVKVFPNSSGLIA